MIKGTHNEEYNEALMALIKRTKESREAILNFLAEDLGHSSILVANFGEKEYSLLSAMNSQ